MGREVDTWWERAQCRDVDPKIFEPPSLKGGRPRVGQEGVKRERDWSRPRAVCTPCPVKQQCLNDALAMAPFNVDGEHLFRAGLTPDQLNDLRSRRRAS